MKPKSKYPELTFDWNNLAFVCAKCNNFKGDSYSEKIPNINPYIEEPLDFIIPIGAMVFPKDSNKRGEITISGIQLNRPGLIERRSERIKQLQNLVDKYKREKNSSLKKVLLREIKIEVEKNKQYVMCSKSFVETYSNEKIN